MHMTHQNKLIKKLTKYLYKAEIMVNDLCKSMISVRSWFNISGCNITLLEDGASVELTINYGEYDWDSENKKVLESCSTGAVQKTIFYPYNNLNVKDLAIYLFSQVETLIDC